MSDLVKTITIYGSSSSKIDSSYFAPAKELGKLMALQNITCINGAGGNGVMGAVTDEMLARGGRVIGIIPQFMIDEGWAHGSIKEIIPTSGMHERKQLMAQKSDACIALPGGIGTLEELLEIMTWKQLGLYENPVIVLNTGGYFNDLLAMLDRAAKENFIHHKHQTIWEVAETPEEALSLALSRREWHSNPRSFAAL